MTELHIPLIAALANGGWTYATGRLHALIDGAVTDIIVMPPDGVFLQTLRIKCILGTSQGLHVTLYRTAKADWGGTNSFDPIATQAMTGPAIINQSISLTASGKNVVDNSIYNYSVRVTAATTPPDMLHVAEIALLY